MSESPLDRERRLDLERHAQELGRRIAGVCPKGVGFTLLLYHFGGAGSMAYMSNGERADMIAMMKELIAALEGRRPDIEARLQS